MAVVLLFHVRCLTTCLHGTVSYYHTSWNSVLLKMYAAVQLIYKFPFFSVEHNSLPYLKIRTMDPTLCEFHPFHILTQCFLLWNQNPISASDIFSDYRFVCISSLLYLLQAPSFNQSKKKWVGSTNYKAPHHELSSYSSYLLFSASWRSLQPFINKYLKYCIGINILFSSQNYQIWASSCL
jgi:hypothetical protein